MRAGILAAAVCAACSLSADYGGTSYLCSDGTRCPAGQECVQGRCQLPVPPPDAAQVIPDAPPPPPPDAPLPGTPDAAPMVWDPPWWDAAWPYRRRLTVTNVSADVVPSDLPVSFRVDIDVLIGDALPYASLRIMHWNESTMEWAQMNRIIDMPPGADEWIWLEMWETLAPGESVDHYWVYYGNATPPDDTYDDNYAMWTMYSSFSSTSPDLVASGSTSVTGGELKLDYDEHVRTTTQWGPGYAVDFELRVPSWDDRFWGGWQRQADFNDDEPWLIWISRGPSAEITPEVLSYAAGMSSAWVGPVVGLDTEPHFYTVERYADRTIFRFDEIITAEHMLPAPFTGTLAARLTNEAPVSIYFDRLRVRPCVRPAPEVVLGAEQSYP